MDLESLVSGAQSNGASDLHLEAGLPPPCASAARCAPTGEPLPAKALLDLAHARSSATNSGRAFSNAARLIFPGPFSGVRCRINILQTTRGVGFAIRLLASFQATRRKAQPASRPEEVCRQHRMA